MCSTPRRSGLVNRVARVPETEVDDRSYLDMLQRASDNFERRQREKKGYIRISQPVNYVDTADS